jgi:hypothetical protein
MIDALPLLLGPEGYQISRSVRLRSSAAAYFNRTPGSAGNRQTWTWSGWVKRGTVSPRVTLFGFGTSAASGGSGGAVYFDSNTIYVVSGGGTATFLSTTPVYRDPSAWYHIVIAFDSTQATASNRVKIYVNGLQVTAFANTTYPSQNYNSDYNNTIAQYIGVRGDGGLDSYFDGYLTEINSIDGQALTPSSFGETNLVTGVWQPKKYAGTYGTNGFYLNFSDNSAATAAAIGKDNSGNGNNWTPNNISVTAGVTYDSMLDVPTQWADGGNGRGNYATLNPVTPFLVNTTLSQGNLVATKAAASTVPKIYGTIGVDSGKWYWEVKLAAQGGAGNYYAIIGAGNHSSPSGNDSTIVTYYGTNDASFAGDKNVNNVVSNYGANYVAGDTIGVALDLDALQITFYKNGTSQGAITGLTAATYFPHMRSDGTSNSATFEANFGQRPFAYTPPTGFKALNTLNLPTPTILKGNQYFDATTYTGTGTTQNITNSGGMQPDLVWTKLRSLSAGHNLVDAVRGVTKALYSNLTNTETTDTNGLTAFNANGFTLGGASGYNNNGATAVAWQWKEGPTQGFDIVTYTGTGSNVARSVAHNLGVAPRLMITKSRDTDVTGTNHWVVWHGTFVAGDYILLSATNAKANASSYWGGTLPNSSNFFVGGSAANVHNENGKNYVAYLFSEVAGFSRIGSYTGNGSADGPFCFTGFLPAFILYKNSSAASQWILYDTARNTYNAANRYLEPNTSDAENTSGVIDVLSNGFKIRQAGTDHNDSGNVYVYAAFASNPFKHSLAR